jgi:2-phospho-L-lactate/phosphoenolpyruvate guanylyltransferase
MTSVILVPVKEHARAKSRLSPLLNVRERALLAWAMLEDLIRVVRLLPVPVVMVTDSVRAAERAEDLGWRVIWEVDQTSESASVDAASRILAQEGIDAVLRLPADLPLVRTEDIAGLLSLAGTPPAAVLAPSWNRMGTNALLRTPPDLFPSRFGHDSFAQHIREAARAKAQVRIVENPRLALDLDDASDIVRFLAQPADGETNRTLTEMNVKEKLLHHGA